MEESVYVLIFQIVVLVAMMGIFHYHSKQIEQARQITKDAVDSFHRVAILHKELSEQIEQYAPLLDKLEEDQP